MTKQIKQFDIIIIGAGLTGLILAIALAKLKLRIAIIDTKVLPESAQPAVNVNDVRALALSYNSQLILTELGLWEELQSQAMPIKKVHVSDRGHFGFTRIHANDYQLPSLGSVIALQHLQQQLLLHAKRGTAIEWFLPAEVIQTTTDNNQRIVEILIQGKPLLVAANLLIAADGSNSTVCRQLKLAVSKTDYLQTAIAATISVNRTHDNTAYERFTAAGPLALLPVTASMFSLVWTLKPEAAETIMTLNEKEFLFRLQQTFGYRLGKVISVGPRQCFSLFLQRLKSLYTERAIALGNAAHTIHPIAGQGFNLGLRDVFVLIKQIKQQLTYDADIGAKEFLQNYAASRANDHKKIIGLTDNLVNIFSNNFLPLSFVRNAALLAIDRTFLKHKLAATLMGFVE